MRMSLQEGPTDVLWKIVMQGVGVSKIVSDGVLILAYDKKLNEGYAAAGACEIEFEGLKILALNRLCTNMKGFELQVGQHQVRRRVRVRLGTRQVEGVPLHRQARAGRGRDLQAVRRRRAHQGCRFLLCRATVQAGGVICTPSCRSACR